MYMYYHHYIEIKKKRNHLNSFAKKRNSQTATKSIQFVTINLRAEINKSKNMQVHVKNKIPGLKKSYWTFLVPPVFALTKETWIIAGACLGNTLTLVFIYQWVFLDVGWDWITKLYIFSTLPVTNIFFPFQFGRHNFLLLVFCFSSYSQ